MKKTMLIVSVLACALGLPRASAQGATQGRFPVSFFVLSANCAKAPADISGSGQGHFVAQTFLRNGNATMTMTFNRQGTASDVVEDETRCKVAEARPDFRWERFNQLTPARAAPRSSLWEARSSPVSL